MLCIVMVSPMLIAFEQATVGRTCRVHRRDNNWVFAFGDSAADGCVVTTDTLWRVVEAGRIALTSEDHGQPFGLPAPMDVLDRCGALFAGRLARSVSVDPWTADVTIQFDREPRLDIISSSAGYENWQAYFRHADQDMTLVGAGGGAVTCVSAPIGSNPKVFVGGPPAGA